MTPKLCKRELLFLYTAPLLIEIYLPMKFQVDTYYSLSRQKLSMKNKKGQ